MSEDQPELDEELSIDTFLHSQEDITRFTAMVAFGNRIFSLANDKSQGLGFVFDKARSAYLEAFNGFLNLDLLAPDGHQKAVHLQGEMRRYLEMVSWLSEATEKAKGAQEELNRMRTRPDAPLSGAQLTEEQANYYGTERTDDD